MVAQPQENAIAGRDSAWAIGGTGIWVMHFMAMIGFSLNKSTSLGVS